MPRFQLATVGLLLLTVLITFLVSSYICNKSLEAGMIASQAEALGMRDEILELRKTLEDERNQAQKKKRELEESLPMLFLITPTYRRDTQKADLTRMCHTLKHVPNLHWIVIEDSDDITPLVTSFLDKCGVPHTQRNMRTPLHMRRAICTVVDPRIGCPKANLGKEEQSWKHPRGVEQRNLGLRVVRELAAARTTGEGVVYFADDDNAYSLEIFELMRKTKRVAVWRVGLSGDMRFEGPEVDEAGRVKSFHVGWKPERPYPVDMAGFAVNVREILSRPELGFDGNSQRGYLETNFIGSIVKSYGDLEALGMDINAVLVWHVRTQETDLKWEQQYPSNPAVEV